MRPRCRPRSLALAAVLTLAVASLSVAQPPAPAPDVRTVGFDATGHAVLPAVPGFADWHALVWADPDGRPVIVVEDIRVANLDELTNPDRRLEDRLDEKLILECRAFYDPRGGHADQQAGRLVLSARLLDEGGRPEGHLAYAAQPPAEPWLSPPGFIGATVGLACRGPCSQPVPSRLALSARVRPDTPADGPPPEQPATPVPFRFNAEGWAAQLAPLEGADPRGFTAPGLAGREAARASVRLEMLGQPTAAAAPDAAVVPPACRLTVDAWVCPGYATNEGFVAAYLDLALTDDAGQVLYRLERAWPPMPAMWMSVALGTNWDAEVLFGRPGDPMPTGGTISLTVYPTEAPAEP